ncbi:copper transporting ATPase [Spiroplasma sabaudiense Ar-1343]|uniref:Copper transporting ATPase n=1 Tax=Spiroplasma sabaudiense Ar-1343 TaxID=1276257 RepID=W6AAR9_9MOLU|nr:cation-translocating P-type ATPase [Spiroplasma sabaudiense]AHI53950.1 copper transporting ATPase [Spiroplasma sabaudiense Ar-1343]
MKSKDYQINGMTCASCATSIKTAVAKVKGVNSVEVNLSLNLMNITSNQEIKDEEIIKTVKKTGYKAKALKATDLFDSQTKWQWIPIINVVMAALLTLPMWLAMILSVAQVHNGFSLFLHNPWFQLSITSVVQFILGAKFYKEFYYGVKTLQANMAFLVVIGSLLAFGLSIYNATLNHWISTMTGKPLYFELSATIVTLVLLGKLLEGGAKNRTQKSLKYLSELIPQTAIVWEDNKEIIKNIYEIQIQEIIIVKAGTSVPFDGTVVQGQGYVNESMLTGESQLVKKLVGDLVSAGTINHSGYFQVEVQKLVNQSTLAQVIQTVKLAQNQKANIQQLVDKISSWFIPIIFAIAFLTFVGWTIYYQGWNEISLVNAITVLVISCPCALGLATPTAILVGTSRAARLGIIYKNSTSLEKLAKIKTMVFDKTGTLTQGDMKIVAQVYQTSKYSQEFLEEVLWSFESQAEHPVAQGIVKSLMTKNFASNLRITNFESIPSFGVKGEVDGKAIMIGSKSLMETTAADTRAFKKDYDNFVQQGLSIVYLSIANDVVAIIGVGDNVKKNAQATITKLKLLNLNPVMLTGDNAQTAAIIGQNLGFEKIISEVKIFEKPDYIKQLQNQTGLVAMIGDGVNDAVALTQADVGISFTSGTDIAIESSDILLLDENIALVEKAFQIATKTFKKIKGNLFWAFLYNILAIPLAAFGLIFPELGALAMVLSSISVILNSLFLKVK